MNKNKKVVKAMSGMLCASMLMGSVTPVFATTNETQTTSKETDSKDVEVTYNKSASYFVTIPKTITLDSNKESTYNVKVEGDIPSDKNVYVAPEDAISQTNEIDFYMHDQSTKHPKADVTAIVTQNKDTWDFEDVANGVEETTNKISATNLTAGNWKGTFNFNINLKGLEVYGEDVTLTKDNLATYGISTTGDVTIPSIVIDSDGTKHKVTKIGTNGKHYPSSIFSDINSITSLTIEEGIKEINEICLKSLTSVSLPNNLETIGNYTFISSQLKNITLPDNIKTIGDSAFQNCNLISSITYKGTTYTNKNNLINALKANNVTFSDTLFDDTLLNYGKDVTLSSDNLATYRIANTGYVTIPSVVTDSDGTKHKVTSIGNMAFYGCSELKSITIKSGVTSIGFRAFYNCSGVTSITIPDSVIDISDMAFYGCSGLTSITMPNGVKNIASNAFQNCSNLTSITYHGTTYTNKTELTNALTSSGVNVGTNVFDGTKLQ